MKADDAAPEALLGKKERDYLKDSDVVEARRKLCNPASVHITQLLHRLFTNSLTAAIELSTNQYASPPTTHVIQQLIILWIACKTCLNIQHFPGLLT